MDQRSASLTAPCLALGGLFQATALVHQVAAMGYGEPDKVNTCLASVLNLNPQQLDDVYGKPAALQKGLEFLCAMLNGRAPHTEPLRIAIAILQLERRFRRQPQRQQGLGRELDLLVQTGGMRDNPSANETIAQLADTWVQYLGNIEPRIMVNGNPRHLKNPDNQSLIRALLLSALRSAVLWRQMGGSRWRLLWQRKAYIQAARSLLND